MKPVNKLEFFWLIKQGYIQQERGKLKDVVVSCGKSKRKTRWVTPNIYENLKFMKDYVGLK